MDTNCTVHLLRRKRHLARKHLVVLARVRSLSLSLIFQLRTPAAVRFVERTAAATATVMSIASNVSVEATASNI